MTDARIQKLINAVLDTEMKVQVCHPYRGWSRDEWWWKDVGSLKELMCLIVAGCNMRVVFKTRPQRRFIGINSDEEYAKYCRCSSCDTIHPRTRYSDDESLHVGESAGVNYD